MHILPPLKRHGGGMTLRVALISTPFVAIPPKGYGGTELVVAELAKALTAQGADVVVYATGDSHLPGIEIRSYFPAPQWPPAHDIERVHTTWSLRDAARDPRGFDIVHVHSASAVEMARLSPYPVLCTLHHDYVPELSDLYRRTPEVRLVAISRSQPRGERAPVAAVGHTGSTRRATSRWRTRGICSFSADTIASRASRRRSR